ncbi:addiction module antidote protein [Dyella subtropica]|uniref:addiction module antidote protein n=1 Tax=Dyella subtropica TaxID=2992127 RepID=UPI0022573C73|nr:addiction module antidote protein [Dyella subtropica]
MTQISEQTGVGRESLYKSLRPGANPAFSTVSKVMAALGLHIEVKPVTPAKLRKTVKKKVVVAAHKRKKVVKLAPSASRKARATD